MQQETRLFVRKTSGLVRTIGWFGALSFGVACISLSSSGLIPYAWVPSLWPGASIIGVLTVAMVLCLFHAYTYASIGAAMPRSGADYALASRVLHPVPAFMGSWTLVLFSALVSGSLIAWIPSSVLSSFLWAWGVMFNSPTALEWSDLVTRGNWVLIIGTICVLVTYVCMLLPTRTIVQIMQWGVILGLAAWVAIYYALGSTADPAVFQQAWDKFMGAGNYAQVIPVAEEHGMKFSPSPELMTLAGLIMGFWIFYGYYIPTFFAGELKNAPQTLLISSWGSLILTWFVFVLGAVLLQRLVPLKWLAAEGYIFYNAPDALRSLPFITFYAGILKPSVLVNGIIFVGFVYTLINLAMSYFFYCSRIIFAWAFDRVMPEAVAYVSPRTGAPVVAITIIAAISELGVYLSQSTNLFVQINFVFYAAVVQIIPVLASILYPYLKKDLWETGPSLVRRKVGNIPVMTLVGVITLAYLLWMIVASFLFPAVGGHIGVGTLVTLGVLLLSGLAVFYLARYYRLKTEGMDILLTFKSIPPV